MAALYIGRYRWPLLSPLSQLRVGKGLIAVFFPPEADTPQAKELLEKILASVHLSFSDAALLVVRERLTRERLSLFSERLLWIMGDFFPPYKVGVYDLQVGKGVAPPTGLPTSGQWVYVLPGLNEMLSEPELKRETWRWIRSLASR